MAISNKPDFYDEQAKSINPLRRWFHTMRHKVILGLVVKYYSNPIVDMGCGNCVWNAVMKLPVIGVDINEDELGYTEKLGRINRSVVADLSHTGLKDNTASTVVCSEALEHLPNYSEALDEIRRILKPGGHLITSVPYDTNLSLWKPLFWVQCIHQGRIKGDVYYKNHCGHINHFSPKSIKLALASAGFDVIEQFDVKRFTIFTVGERR